MTDEIENDDNVIHGVPFGDTAGKCPNCGSLKTVPILYGYHIGRAMDAYRRGEIQLGGCIIRDDNPNRHRQECRKRW